MSRPTYTVGHADVIRDPYVITEFQRLEAHLKSLQTQLTEIEAARGLEDHTTPPLLKENPDRTSPSEDGVRWLTGPWLIGPDGSAPNNGAPQPPFVTSIIAPAPMSTDQHNWAPPGIDTAIMVEAYASVPLNITGIRIGTNHRRIVGLLNRGGGEISLVNQSTLSEAPNRFEWGTSGDVNEALVLVTGAVVWLYYDPGTQRWRLFALPSVGAQHLPESLVPVTEFPPAHDWFAARLTRAGTGFAAIGVGCVTPTLSQTTNSDASTAEGLFQLLNSGNAVGNAAGVLSGGANEFRFDQDPTWEVLMRTGPSLAAVRIWVLFADSTSGFNSDDPSSGRSYVGFRYSTVASDPGWIGASSDGVAQAVTGKVADIAVSTTYALRVRKDGATVYFSVNGGTEVSHTSRLPAANITPTWFAFIWTQETEIKGIAWGRMWCRSGSVPTS